MLFQLLKQIKALLREMKNVALVMASSRGRDRHTLWYGDERLWLIRGGPCVGGKKRRGHDDLMAVANVHRLGGRYDRRREVDSSINQT